jgi:hypothetical protein
MADLKEQEELVQGTLVDQQEADAKNYDDYDDYDDYLDDELNDTDMWDNATGGIYKVTQFKHLKLYTDCVFHRFHQAIQ